MDACRKAQSVGELLPWLFMSKGACTLDDSVSHEESWLTKEASSESSPFLSAQDFLH